MTKDDTSEKLGLSMVFREGAPASEVQVLLAYLSEILKEMQSEDEGEDDASCALCSRVNDTPGGE